MKILAISGSLRSSSSNTAILKALIGLAADDLKIEIYQRIGQLPHFNPEIDHEDALPIVADWRNQLKRVDGVIFSTPEYAHGIPGVLKNALDWLVSSGELMHKPTAVISASPAPEGGKQANASLVQTLSVMMAQMNEGSTLCLPAISNKVTREGQIIEAETERSLQLLLGSLKQSCGMTPDQT